MGQLRQERALRADPLVKSFLMTSTSVLEAVLRRDRAIIIGALGVLTVLAWADLVWLADDMSMGGMDMTGFRMIPAGQSLMMPASEPWTPIEFVYVFLMWAVMMIGMMTPSAAPMILIYARVGRRAVMDGTPFAATAWFVGGYLLAWIAFSLAATSAQWALERATLLTPMMASASNILGGVVLVFAGLYQWTPLKDACLFHCQAPLTFILRHGGFRGDLAGADARLASRHLLYRLLLGADGALVRRWRHEFFLDRRTCNPGVAGESHPVRPGRRAACWSDLYGGGRMDTDATCLRDGGDRLKPAGRDRARLRLLARTTCRSPAQVERRR